MEVVPTVFTVVLVVLAIVLSVVGVQMFLILVEVKKTLKKVNQTIDTADEKLSALIQPLQKVGSMASGLGTGLKVFETFVGWLNRDKKDAKEEK